MNQQLKTTSKTRTNHDVGAKAPLFMAGIPLLVDIKHDLLNTWNMARSKNAKSPSLLLKLLLFSLTILLSIIMIYLLMRQQQLNSIKNTVQEHTSQTTITVPKNWKTYKNTKYGYMVKYPPTGEWGDRQEDGTFKNIKTANIVALTDQNLPVDAADSVLFDLDVPLFGPPIFYISVLNNTKSNMYIHGTISKTSLDNIFALKIGQETDRKTTEDLDGSWNRKGIYKRLPDIKPNSLKFKVIENSHAYGGIDRRMFLEKENIVFMLGKTYTEEKYLIQFEQFYSSFEFID